MNSIAQSYITAEQFLNALYGQDPPGWRVVWTSPDKVSRWIEARQAAEAVTVSKNLTSMHDVYFNVGLQGKRLDRKQRGGSDGVIAIPGLWLDVDCLGGVHTAANLPTFDEAREFLNEFSLPLSVLVHSGGGLYPYWLFPELWVFKDNDHDRAETLLAGFKTAFVARAASRGWKLDSTADLARVLRLPGMLNRKYSPPATVRVLEFHPERRYGLDEIAEAIETLTARVPKKQQPARQETGADDCQADAVAIFERCAFLRHCRDDAAILPEPEWYAAISIIARAKDGEALCHELSRAHPGYSERETGEKIRHSLKDTGPYTCERIRADFCLCAGCKERVSSPIVLGRPKAAPAWMEPEPIQATLRAVEKLPAGIIPEPFRGWLTDIAHRMQCPLDFVAVAAIVEAGAVIGAGCGIRPKQNDDWTVIPNLWGGVIAPPSMLKTPALAEAMKPVASLEAAARDVYEADLSWHEAENEAFRAQKDALKSEMLTAAKGHAKKGEVVPDLDEVKNRYANLDEPETPSRRRYKTNDSTIEKVAELLNQNPRGILVFRDELVGLLVNWDREDRQTDRAFYLEAWGGLGSFTTDRIGRGTIDTQNLCVSILGGIQPSKLTGYLLQANDDLQNDGLLQRFQILVYPDELTNWRLIDERPNVRAREYAYEIYDNLSNMDFTQDGAELPKNDKIPFFHFSPEAQAVFNTWLTELQAKIKNEGTPLIAEHLSKYRSLMPSLALIFHLIGVANDQPAGPVTRLAAEQAAAWCEYLESHARRIYGLLADISVRAAEVLAEKIKKSELADGFSIRDVYHNGWHLLDKKEIVEQACNELVDAGWLRPDFEDVPGRQPKEVFMINPKIFPSNA